MRGLTFTSLLCLASLAVMGCADGLSPSESGAGTGESDDGSGGEDSEGEGGDGGAGEACGPAVDLSCPVEGWCFDTPPVADATFLAVDVTADATSALAVGADGVVFHSCGGAWVLIDAGTKQTLSAVFHPSPDFAIAAGSNGTVLRWDGSSWSPVASPTEATLTGVWGAAEDDVWIVGEADELGTVMLHWDGHALRRVEDVETLGYSLYAIDGRGQGDIIAVGGAGGYDASLRFDGLRWLPLTFGAVSHDGGQLDDVVALADGTTVARFDGWNTSYVVQLEDGAWPFTLFEDTPGVLVGLHEDETGKPAVALCDRVDWTGCDLLRFSEGAWNPTGETLSQEPSGIWSGPAAGALAFGWGSMMFQRIVGTWSQARSLERPSFGFSDFRAVGDTLTATLSDQIARRVDGEWTYAPMTAVPTSAASIADDGRAFRAMADGRIIDEHGEPLSAQPPLEEYPYSMVAYGADDIWVGRSDGGPVHFDGNVWTVLPDNCPFANNPDMFASVSLTSKIWRGHEHTIYSDSYEAVTVWQADGTCSHLRPAPAFPSWVSAVAEGPAGELWVWTNDGSLYERDGDIVALRDADVGAQIEAAIGGTIDGVNAFQILTSSEALVGFDSSLSSESYTSHVATIDLDTFEVVSVQDAPHGTLVALPQEGRFVANWQGVLHQEP